MGPVFRIILVGDGEDANLVSLPVEFLDGRVVGVLVGNIERSLERAAIGILPLSVENAVVQVDIVAIDSTVEGDGDHLGNLVRVDASGHPGAVGRAEAVGQLALAEVAVGGPVGVEVDGAGVLVGSILAVGGLVAEKLLVNADAVAALKLAVGTDGLVSLQVGFGETGL